MARRTRRRSHFVKSGGTTMKMPLYITRAMRSKHLLTAAKAYAEAGIPVLGLWPVDDDGNCACGDVDCSSLGKHPISSFFPHGHKDATTSKTIIRRVWRKYPDANIGLVIEGENFVIDLDARGNTQAGRQLAAYNLPETATVRTGRGKHFYYRWLGQGIPPRLAKVDYRKEGKGYVVAPPSRHATGVRYRWGGQSKVVDIPPSFFLPSGPFGDGNSAIRRKIEYLSPLGHDWRQVVKKYAKHISHETRRLIEHDRVVGAPDRSKLVFKIGMSLFKAGADEDEVASVVWRSPYFTSKWGEDYHKLNAEIARIKAAFERGAS